MLGSGGQNDMSPNTKFILNLVWNNIFWAFLILMIVLGSALDTPFINVGLTAR